MLFPNSDFGIFLGKCFREWVSNRQNYVCVKYIYVTIIILPLHPFHFHIQWKIASPTPIAKIWNIRFLQCQNEIVPQANRLFFVVVGFLYSIMVQHCLLHWFLGSSLQQGSCTFVFLFQHGFIPYMFGNPWQHALSLSTASVLRFIFWLLYGYSSRGLIPIPKLLRRFLGAVSWKLWAEAT